MLVRFYGHGTTTYNNTRDFVLEQSIFMRERVQTLDKTETRFIYWW